MKMKKSTMGFIGGGRVTRIILEGFERKDSLAAKISVCDSNADVLAKLRKQFPGIETLQGGVAEAASMDIVFICLHPPMVGGALGEIKAHLKTRAVVVSFAPKVTISQLSAGLGGFDRIVRMIPNAPSIVNKGYNAVTFADGFDKKDKKELLSLFKCLGDCPEVEEGKLEAYAILSAMGPTYFWFQLNELQKLGSSFGLTAGETDKTLSRMMKGAIKTLFESEMSFEEVADLIPVKPLGEEDANIRTIYKNKLEGLYQKLKG
jgi:pyrroline-5-carboxylate reductase